MKKTEPLLGQGVYSLDEAARYTQMASRKLRAWFVDRRDTSSAPIFYGDYDSVEGRVTLSFYDLIDAHVAAELRKREVTMHAVRRIFAYLERELETEHPFCHKELYTDGKTVLYGAVKGLKDDALLQVFSQQQYFGRIMRVYLDRVDYSPDSQIAERWRIQKGVVIDPAITFGKPVVENTGTSTFVLAEHFYANKKNTRLVASLFDLQEVEVRRAVRFESRHKLPVAA